MDLLVRLPQSEADRLVPSSSGPATALILGTTLPAARAWTSDDPLASLRFGTNIVVWALTH